MDDDPVLRELAADLEREDPRLADLLAGAVDEPQRLPRWLLLLSLGPPLLMGLFVLNEVAFGTATILLVITSPLIVCWLLTPPTGRPTPGPG
jgi:hypothetical protein